jgi:DNA-3-methyladenine glycosylase II
MMGARGPGAAIRKINNASSQPDDSHSNDLGPIGVIVPEAGEEQYEPARRHLTRSDPILAAIIRRVGPCKLVARRREDHLTALAQAIVSQQLSNKAATTIFGRLTALFPNGRIPDAAAIAALSDVELRSVGLSGQKTGYFRDLCARIADGRLKLEELDELDDEQVVERLTAVKGFGRWTAEMFLIFRLLRPDVLPVGDLGIITAVQKAYRLRSRPDSKRILKIGESWRPYRSIASWYLWQSLKP